LTSREFYQRAGLYLENHVIIRTMRTVHFLFQVRRASGAVSAGRPDLVHVHDWQAALVRH